MGFLREADAGLPVKDLSRRHSFSEASHCLWRSKFVGMSVSDAKRLKELETENARMKKLFAQSLLENEVTLEIEGQLPTKEKILSCEAGVGCTGQRHEAQEITYEQECGANHPCRSS